MFRLFVIFLTASALSACGHGDGSEPGGSGGNTSATATIEPTLASIQDNVFTPTCGITGCHGSIATQAGLVLVSGSSYSSLVNVPSSQFSGLVRVIPSDPNNSLIIQKLEGAPNVGFRMPWGGPYLSQSTIDVIRQWIANGAPNS